ncbi:MAG TPA: prephenate dehydrogenase/arogenate dehydrogenase family protein [Anaerolineaceae bacterium]|nr:prephenate dehydrogenase/arogenate dehydrogenase family protein [Anaerolineaceae bacterium]
MAIQLTILGLNQVGASLGLALQPYKEELQRTGHDPDSKRASMAQKLGAVDRTSINLPASVENADVIVLALPLDEVRKTLEVIAPVTKSGCVILDMSTNKIAIAGWAKELLPEERYFVTMAPSLNPNYLHETDLSVHTAHDDLFKNGVMVISSPPGMHADAIKLASDITLLVGAKPYFADPYEMDGLNAASDTLPKLVAAAVMNANHAQPSWREGRKLASRAFAAATEPVLLLDEDAELGQSALLNAENTLRVLDDLMAELQEVRGLIATQDREGLKAFLEEAKQGREEWWSQRQSADWDQLLERPDYPTTGEIFGRLFGIRKRQKDKK